jgi:hypothetical protein
MSVSFTTTLRQAETKNATGISVPPDKVAELGGGKAPLVKVTVNGYSYRGKVAVYGGECLIGFSAEHRDATGINGGDTIDVTLELDTEPRMVEVPDDLLSALKEANLMEVFEKAAPSRRKEYVRQVVEAKSPETRERRIGKIVDELS